MFNLFSKKIIPLIGCLFFSSCNHSQKSILYHWQKKQQMIVVITDGWYSNRGKLYKFEYLHSKWHKKGNGVSVSLGSQGLAWGRGLHPFIQEGLYKKEGDKRSPVGMFKIGFAFGYRNNLSINYPYHVMTQYDYCIDDPTSSQYNQIIDKQNFSLKEKFILSEPMRRDIHFKGDQLYKLGFVIEHNEKNIPHYGSCIFAHLRKNANAVTSGCTAMDEKDMTQILRWLDPDYHPIYVLLPKVVYHQKQQVWNLPSIKND